MGVREGGVANAESREDNFVCRESWFEEGHSKGWGLKFANLSVDFWFFQFDQWETIILRLWRERSVFVGSSREGIRE